MTKRYLPGREDYNDMLDLQRPVSKKRIPLSMESRAAQFAPFAALTGFEWAIQKAGNCFEEEAERGGRTLVLPELAEENPEF